MFIEPRKPVTVEELLHGMIVQSGNDACIALAEAVAGSEPAFVERMNREAARLGMTGTNFTNSSGLPDPGHYSTASDLALLTSALIRDYPEYYKLYSEREYRYNDITQRNRNQQIEEHTSELQSLTNIVCRLLLEKKTNKDIFQSGY